MKTFTLLTSILILILTNQMFSQANNGFELKQDLLLQERIIPHSIQYEIAEYLSESDIFNKNDFRILVNKTILQNGFLLIERTNQDWDGSNWVNISRYTYNYDGNNNMIEELWQEWIGSNWVNGIKYTYTYDGNNNMVEVLYQYWDGSNWVNGGKVTYSYIITEIEQLADGIKIYSLSNNYPNPFNPTTKIKYQIPEISFVNVKVYDVLGNEITTLVNQEKPAGYYEIEFIASYLASGIYYYRIQAGDFVEIKKMILLR